MRFEARGLKFEVLGLRSEVLGLRFESTGFSFFCVNCYQLCQATLCLSYHRDPLRLFSQNLPINMHFMVQHSTAAKFTSPKLRHARCLSSLLTFSSRLLWLVVAQTSVFAHIRTCGYTKAYLCNHVLTFFIHPFQTRYSGSINLAPSVACS